MQPMQAQYWCLCLGLAKRLLGCARLSAAPVRRGICHGCQGALLLLLLAAYTGQESSRGRGCAQYDSNKQRAKRLQALNAGDAQPAQKQAGSDP